MRLSKDQALALAEQIIAEQKNINNKERQAYKKTQQYKTKHEKIMKSIKAIDKDIRRMIDYDIWLVDPNYVEELIMKQRFGERHRSVPVKVIASHVKVIAIEAKTVNEIKEKVNVWHHSRSITN